MAGLTDSAKEEFGPWMRFRLRLASFVVSLGFRVMPKPYWDDVREEEVKQMAERYDLEVVERAQ